MMNNLFNNPFVACTSKDMSYQDVFQYWCDPFRCFDIDEKLLFTSKTPIFIQGVRGSGKTMILKYLSYFCQKEISKKERKKLMKHIQTIGGIGFYFRYKSEFGETLNNLDCSQQEKVHIFSYYFELFVMQEILAVLSDMNTNHDLSKNEVSRLEKCISAAMSLNKTYSLHELCKQIEDSIWSMDEWIGMQAYKADEKKITSLIHVNCSLENLCKIISETIVALKETRFLIIIDEYENANEFQKIINTYVKQVDEKTNITYRIGMRVQGLVTFATNVHEDLRINRDYLSYILASQQMRKYKIFLKEIAKRRLEKELFFRDNNLLDITAILGIKEKFDEEANRIVGNRSDKIFEKFKIQETDRKYLENKNFPLMQMLNIVWYNRKKRTPEQIQAAMHNFIKKEYNKNATDAASQDAYKYHLDYTQKYRLQLLCMLCGLFAVPKEYYSFNTLAYLSSGVVNDFITLCRYIFYNLNQEDMELLSSGKPITPQTQTHSVTRAASSHLDYLQTLDCKESSLYLFALNMGEIFKEMHKDMKARYPETNQLAFYDEKEIEDDASAKQLKDKLLMQGVLIKKQRKQRISLGKGLGTIYVYSRFFAPLFNMSYRTRGGFNYILSRDLFLELASKRLPQTEIAKLQNKKLGNMIPPESTPVQLKISFKGAM